MLYIYSLDVCPYSIKSEKLLKPYKPTIIKVSSIEKEKYKIENKMNTFPQIFLVYKNIKIKIGGLDDTVNLLDKIFKNNDISYSNEEKKLLINFFLNK